MEYNARAARAVQASNCVGLISRIYGKGGELAIKLLDTFPESGAELLWVEIDSIATPLFLCSFSMQGNSKAVVVFEDFQSEDLATTLLGLKLYAENAESIDDEESDLDFLIQYTFKDTTSSLTGRVVEVYPSELNPLINVDFGGDRGEVLVPIADDLIEKIDNRRKILTMNLAEGFFE